MLVNITIRCAVLHADGILCRAVAIIFDAAGAECCYAELSPVPCRHGALSRRYSTRILPRFDVWFTHLMRLYAAFSRCGAAALRLRHHMLSLIAHYFAPMPSLFYAFDAVYAMREEAPLD